jgi:class 3 adenylate cyclase
MERAVSATYTVMFTDLVDSTAQRARIGDNAADDLRRRHDALLSAQVQAHSGEVIKSTGDGIMAAFLGAADGIACAVAVQQSIHEWNESNVEQLGVRIGISLGDARLENGDLFGTPVVEAARLCARAEGEEILCADVVRVVAGSRATQRFTPVGALELKGLAAPLPTVRVEWEPRIAVEGGLPFPNGLEPTGRFPFVGRHPELDTLVSLWRGTVDGRSSLVLVSGEPGIGKTRISSELARRVHSQGLTVVYGRCDDELGVPYQPFVEALAFVVDNFEPEDFVQVVGRHAAELTRLVPRLADHIPDLTPPVSADPETSQYRLFEAVAGTLVAASNLQPILFVIDDLHWAAKPTLLLLRHIVSSTAAARLMIVGTYRDSDLYRAQPLAEILGDLRRIDGVERIALTGLDAPEVREFMTRVAGHELDAGGAALAQMIYDETDGNPLFTGEVLRHLHEVGAIYEVDGRWTTRGDVTEIGIPDGVREVIGRRLSRLAPATNDVLQVGAVVGRSFDMAVVQRLVDLDRDDLLMALDEAVEARVIGEVAIGHYTFSHALVRSALYDELRPTRRARLHERVAEAVSDVYADSIETHLGELAYHYARSIGTGDVNKAIEYSQRAGERALAQLAFDDAVSWFQQADELIEDGGGDRSQLAQVLMGLGVAQKYAGVPAFRETLLAAASQAEKDGDPAVLAAAALANTRGFWSGYGDMDHALANVFRTAIAGLTPSMRCERAKLLANLAVETVFEGTLESRKELADEALAIARQVGDDATLAHVLVSRSVALWDMSTLDERIDHGRELTGLTAAIGDPISSTSLRGTGWRHSPRRAACARRTWCTRSAPTSPAISVAASPCGATRSRMRVARCWPATGTGPRRSPPSSTRSAAAWGTATRCSSTASCSSASGSSRGACPRSPTSFAPRAPARSCPTVSTGSGGSRRACSATTTRPSGCSTSSPRRVSPTYPGTSRGRACSGRRRSSPRTSETRRVPRSCTTCSPTARRDSSIRASTCSTRSRARSACSH